MVNETYSRKLVHLSSHKSSIKNLFFLPAGLEVDRRNPAKFVRYEGDTYPDQEQFITISHDGQFLIWDLNFSDPKEKKITPLQETEFQKVTWKALICLQVFKNDNKSMYINNAVICPDPLTSKIYFTNEEGLLNELDYDIDANFNKEINKLYIIKNVYSPYNECNSIDIDASIFIKGLILVVTEVNFCLYYEKHEYPVFVSQFSANTKYTCGRFSNRRPSVVYIGRNDGGLDIWDFCDQTSQPSQQHLVSAVGLSFIQINQNNFDLLAIGDDDSCIKLLSLPQNLHKKLSREESFMLEFIQREGCRDQFYNKKYVQIDAKL